MRSDPIEFQQQWKIWYDKILIQEYKWFVLSYHLYQMKNWLFAE